MKKYNKPVLRVEKVERAEKIHVCRCSGVVLCQDLVQVKMRNFFPF